VAELNVLEADRELSDRPFADFEAADQARESAHCTVDHYSDILRRVLHGYCERTSVATRGAANL
jgi:hypothetical protein